MTTTGAPAAERGIHECTPPADLGLVLNEHGTWTVPSNGVDFKEVFA